MNSLSLSIRSVCLSVWGQGEKRLSQVRTNTDLWQGGNFHLAGSFFFLFQSPLRKEKWNPRKEKCATFPNGEKKPVISFSFFSPARFNKGSEFGKAKAGGDFTFFAARSLLTREGR